mmetsp:Transcript_35685/g.80589  ORF Transcript_35685/g.80589 Transcript_35685/m.80589 type:complete len:84 (+) Transcript_35685:3161-3412(+)
MGLPGKYTIHLFRSYTSCRVPCCCSWVFTADIAAQCFSPPSCGHGADTQARASGRSPAIWPMAKSFCITVEHRSSFVCHYNLV